MELKKGDAIAVIAEVVGEQRDRIWISIQGATGNDAPLLVPKHKVRLLERVAEVGDLVTHKKEGEFVFHRRESESLALLLRRDAAPGDPEGYVMAQIRDVRRADQSGAVKFAPIGKPIPDAEAYSDIASDAEEVEREVDDASEHREDVPVDRRYDLEEGDSASRADSAPEDSAHHPDDGSLVSRHEQEEDQPQNEEDPTVAEEAAEDAADHDAEDGIEATDEQAYAADAITIEMPDAAPTAPMEGDGAEAIRIISAVREDAAEPAMAPVREQAVDEAAPQEQESEEIQEQEEPAPVDPEKVARVEHRRDETLAHLRNQEPEDTFSRLDLLSKKGKDA